MSEKEKSWLEGGWNEGAGVGGGHDAQALTWPTTCVTVIVGQMGDMGRHGKSRFYAEDKRVPLCCSYRRAGGREAKENTCKL